MKFDKEIRELFELSMQVLAETDHHVKFEVDDHMCSVYIMHDGFKIGGHYDGMYHISSGNEPRYTSKVDYENAKSHLLRLLGDTKGGNK